MTNCDREEKRQNFINNQLQRTDWQSCRLAADASSRIYYRITTGDKNYILLDDATGTNKCDLFVRLSALLRESGVYAPEVLAADLQNHFLLLEDFGDGTFTRLLTTENERELYLKGTEALLAVSRVRCRPEGIGVLNEERIAADILFLLDDYYPLAAGKEISPAYRQKFVQLVQKLLPMAFRVPSGLVLWDYHVDNLMLLPDGNCGVLDFQDALWGPLTYDVMSLVEDARREVSPQVAAEMTELFFQGLKNVSREDFTASYKFMAMFRHMRVLGRFAALYVKNGKDRYLQFIPHVWKMLEQTLLYPGLAEMRQLIDDIFPPELRCEPQRRKVNQAFLLAAGRGVRMENLTDNCPKPLVKVGGKALIDYNFDKLAKINLRRVTVNVCYLAEQIKTHLAGIKGFNLQISEEAEALETGGGIKKAMPLLDGGPLLVLNSDTFWLEETGKSNLERLVEAWDDNKYDIVLLLQPLDKIIGDGGIGNYKVTDGRLRRNVDKAAEGYPYLFTGASILHPRIFAGIEAEKFSLRDLFDRAESCGRLGWVEGQGLLFHVGTPKAVDSAENYLKDSK